MKTKIFSSALLLGAALLAACSSDETTPVKEPITQDVTDGFFILGSGNARNNIDGNLSYIDLASDQVTHDVFSTVNGKSVGKTANYITAYGSKLYIVVDAEATIWVCDQTSLAVLHQIRTTDLLGATEGLSPRAAVGVNGMLYFTCYGASTLGQKGIVASIDTLSFAKQDTFAVGSYPDGLTLAHGCLYVANSDYGQGLNPSISKIDLSTKQVTEIKDDLITNPMHMLTIGDDAYVLDYGTYDENWNQTGAGVRKITPQDAVSFVVPGTSMCSDGTKIYTVNAPFGAAETTYPIFDTTTGATTEWHPEGIFSPALIAANPINGDLYIVSYQENPDTHYPDYSLPSYTIHYDHNGEYAHRYDNTATGPISIAFNKKTVTYVDK